MPGMQARTWILAGGGTGGHLMPGIAVAEALRAARPGDRIVFVTSSRALDRAILEPGGFEMEPLCVEPWPGAPRAWPRFVRCWFRSRRQARSLLRSLHPDAVLGLGGFAAGPTVVEAARAGIRTALLNPDARAGRANRYLARRVERVFVQWPVACRSLPDPRRAVVAGCPVRRAFASVDAGQARRRLALRELDPVLVVTGASQGARTINDALIEAWPWFVRQHPNWQLVHLSGTGDYERVRAAYARAGVTAKVLAFSHDMHAVLAAADVVVSRAGASTLAELCVVGRPGILLPYPWHRDRHQYANAEQLVSAGAALLVEDQRDAEANARALLAALERLCDARVRAAMARMARSLARPDAAEVVARWLIDPQATSWSGRPVEAAPEAHRAAQVRHHSG